MKQSDLTDSVLMDLYNTKDPVTGMPIPVMFIGPPGHGKTSRVKQFCDKLNFGLVTEYLSTREPPDLGGYVIPAKNEKGQAVSKVTLPNIMEQVERCGREAGIVFFDEAFQAEHPTQKAAAPYLSEHGTGEHKLPPAWAVWGASNRIEDRAGVNRPLGHMVSRVCFIHLECDPEGWLRWAGEKKLHPMGLAYAKAFPGEVFNPDPPKDVTKPACNPRSYTYALQFLAQNSNGMELRSDSITQEIVSGYIGEASAAQLFAWSKVVDILPTLDQILDKPDMAPLPPDERLDAQYAAMQMCVHYADAEKIEPLFAYVCRLNRELQTSAAEQMLERSGGALLNSPTLTKWITENRALIVGTLGG
jgi:hypothetical protein